MQQRADERRAPVEQGVPAQKVAIAASIAPSSEGRRKAPMSRACAPEVTPTVAACIQWIADGLLVPQVVVIADDHEVAGLQHFGGGLGEAALVTVQHRHGDAGPAGPA